jgi:Zn-dependent alcohol dehydrogenase
MKAVILEEINKRLAIGDVTLTDLSFGQVLVKVLASGICGAQLQEIAGHKNNAAYVPHLLGHEGAGIVEKIGVGVTKVKIGDKVVMHWRQGDGIEADFPSYVYRGKTIKSGKVTTFSEYSIVSENRITPVPHDTPNELCALLGCGLSTALGTINNEAEVRFGESVMIIGAGGLGLNLVRAATLSSAYPIVSVDIYDSKKDSVESLGSHLFINCKKDNIKDKLFEKLGIKEIDVIIDTSGNKQSLEDTIPLLSGRGRYVLVGQSKPGESIEIKNASHLFGGEGKMIRATQGGKFSPTKDIPRYVKLYKAGILKIDDIITHRIKLNEINDAIELVRSGQAGRIIIDIW